MIGVPLSESTYQDQPVPFKQLRTAILVDVVDDSCSMVGLHMSHASDGDARRKEFPAWLPMGSDGPDLDRTTKAALRNPRCEFERCIPVIPS